MSVRVVLEETGFGVRAAVLVDDRLVEIRDSDRDDPRRERGAVRGSRHRGRRQAQRRVPRLRAAAAGAPGRQGRPRRCRPGGAAADPAAGARGRPADRPGRARGRGRQGGAGHQRSQAVRLRPGLQPGRRGGGAGAAAGPAARAKRCGCGPRSCSPTAGSRCAATRPSCRTTPCMAEAKELAERWRRLEAGSRTAKPGRLPQPETALQRLLRGLVDLGPQTIEIADRALLLEMERLRAASATLPPFELVRLDPDEPAFAQTEVDVELEVALASRGAAGRGRPAADRAHGGLRGDRRRRRRPGAAGRRPRGRGRDRAPGPAAQSGRHHHRRLRRPAQPAGAAAARGGAAQGVQARSGAAGDPPDVLARHRAAEPGAAWPAAWRAGSSPTARGAAAAAASHRRGPPPSGCWRRCMVRAAWSHGCACRRRPEHLLDGARAPGALRASGSACSQSSWPTPHWRAASWSSRKDRMAGETDRPAGRRRAEVPHLRPAGRARPAAVLLAALPRPGSAQLAQRPLRRAGGGDRGGRRGGRSGGLKRVGDRLEMAQALLVGGAHGDRPAPVARRRPGAGPPGGRARRRRSCSASASGQGHPVPVRRRRRAPEPTRRPGRA